MDMKVRLCNLDGCGIISSGPAEHAGSFEGGREEVCSRALVSFEILVRRGRSKRWIWESERKPPFATPVVLDISSAPSV